jgi:hypothetical protein
MKPKHGSKILDDGHDTSSDDIAPTITDLGMIEKLWEK